MQLAICRVPIDDCRAEGLSMVDKIPEGSLIFSGSNFEGLLT